MLYRGARGFYLLNLTGRAGRASFAAYLPRASFTSSSTRLYRLKRAIDENILEGKLNELNLREANHHDPRIVIRAVESCHTSGFPRDEGVLREYLRALVLTNTLDSRSLRPLLETQGAGLADPKLNVGAAHPQDKILNMLDRNEIYLKVDEKNPIHVVVNPSQTNGM